MSKNSLLKAIFHIRQESPGFLNIACIFFACCFGLLKLWTSDYTGKSCSWLTYTGFANQWLKAFVPMVCEGMNRGSVIARMKKVKIKKKVPSLQNHSHKFVSYILCSLHWSQWKGSVQLCKDKPIYKFSQDSSSHLWCYFQNQNEIIKKKSNSYGC